MSWPEGNLRASRANSAGGISWNQPSSRVQNRTPRYSRKEINPVVGQEISLNNRRGKVLSVTPGRVLVDYNHPLAGKTIYYKYKVNQVKDNLQGEGSDPAGSICT